ncbi:hypothetical protein TrVFT333_006327 [Trichoderma virens FT-333]|nr:hypothetical protein TrVFT333_006327 [Trichoderma virens FT-333]
MTAYSQDQLTRYLEHISYPRSKHPRDELQLLTELQAHHLARVPFESIGLHYSPHRILSLDPDDLFEKVVEKSKGGYCLEMNTFFCEILRVLGFTVLPIGARVKVGPRYGGIGKLEFRPLAQSTSPSTQALWVYSSQDDPSAEWVERYCFTETEYFREDYEVNNYFCSTHRTSIFVNQVIVLRGILNDKGDGLSGVLTMFQGEVRKRVEGVDGMQVMETMNNEEERVKALEKWFQIPLTKSEARAILKLPSELTQVRKSAVS